MDEIKSTVPSRNKEARASRRARRPDGVRLDEMRRLMRVYGPTKSLRARGQPDGGADGKAESVKRKFYRWFADLDERFERDKDSGTYAPRLGHESEMRYREESRAMDMEAVRKKRAAGERSRIDRRKAEKAPDAEMRRGDKMAVNELPLDELRRLMRVYGPTKCQRKEGRPDVKVGSVKRKFRRWFPDFEERFERDECTGRYVPKLGHEFELRYREEMRAMDREVLAKKRSTGRKQKNSEKEAEEEEEEETDAKAKANHAELVFSFQGPEEEEWNAGVRGIKSETDLGLMTDAADEESLESSFIAQEGIFDDVEESFFGLSSTPGDAAAQDGCVPLLSSSSCTSGSLEEEQGPSGSSGSSALSV